jgi:hypothetical protein
MMPKPVKLSDTLYDAAREAADLSHRSLSAQVEHWATLGRAIEGQITTRQTSELVRGVQEARALYGPPLTPEIAERVAATVDGLIDGSFSRHMRDTLRKSGTPVYGHHAQFPGKLVRYNTDGTLTPGRMVQNEFVPEAMHIDPKPPALANDK